MRKLMCVLLAALLMLCCAAFAEEETIVIKAGELAGDNNADQHFDHLTEEHPESVKKMADLEVIPYDSMGDLLLALRRGDISVASCARNNAEYIMARSDEFVLLEDPGLNISVSYSMLMLEENADLYERINRTILDMKADGSLDAMIEREIEGYINVQEDPKPIELPHFEGASTVRVAVSGDLPPMDFVAPDGTPAGFNVALLSEISNRTEINFEIVTVSASARMSALSAGKVDMLFWTNNSYCREHDFSAAIELEGTLVTEPYLIDDLARVFKAG